MALREALLASHRERVASLETNHPDSVKLAVAYTDLGDALYLCELWDEARLFFEKAASICERKAKKSVHMANVYHDLGCVLCKQNELEKGCEYFRNAAAIYERRNYWWYKPLSLAHNYFDLAEVIFWNQADFERSLHYYRMALRVYQRRAPRSLQLANCCYGLGQLLYLQGALAEARLLFMKSLKITKRQQGPHSLRVAEISGHLAYINSRLGDETRARLHYDCASWILFLFDFPPSMNLAFVYGKLGDYLYTQGEERKQEVRVCCERALEIDLTLDTSPSYRLISDYFNLGWLFYEQGDGNSALECYNKALRHFEEFKDCQSIIFLLTASLAAYSFYGSGLVLHDQRHYQQSLVSLQSALRIYEMLGKERMNQLHGCNPRPLPTSTSEIKQRIALNPSHLVAVGDTMAPLVWCHALAKLQVVDAVYFVLREHPQQLIRST